MSVSMHIVSGQLKAQAFIAQRNFAERARLFELHSSGDGRMGSGAISR